MSKALWAILLLILGAVFGPLLFALGEAVVSSQIDKDSLSRSKTIHKLLSAYENDQIGLEVMHTLDVGANGHECGYEPELLFDNNHISSYSYHPHREYNDYTGYIYLYDWKNHNSHLYRNHLISQFIGKNIRPLDRSILANCIEMTVFSNFCINLLRNVIEDADRNQNISVQSREISNLLGIGNEIKVICRFIDGVAARRGIPLVTRRNSGS